MDIPDVGRIFHYGPPSSIDEYIQETGRAGRDGRFAHAIILRHKYALQGIVSPEMKEYVSGKGCRRATLLKAFNCEPTLEGTFYCCDNCTSPLFESCCSCDSNISCNHERNICYCVKWCQYIPKLELAVCKLVTESPTVVRIVDKEALVDIKNELEQLNKCSSLQPSSVCNIYPELIDTLLQNCQYIKNENDVLNLGALSNKDAKEILFILDRYSTSLENTE